MGDFSQDLRVLAAAVLILLSAAAGAGIVSAGLFLVRALACVFECAVTACIERLCDLFTLYLHPRLSREDLFHRIALYGFKQPFIEIRCNVSELDYRVMLTVGS